MATGLPQLGSLAQKAREKQINSARGILLVIGILTIAVNMFFYTAAESQVDEAINKEIAKVRAPGTFVDQAKVRQFRDQAVRITKLINGSAAALGVLFVVFGLTVKSYPVPITIVSLVLYVGAVAVFGLIAPETLLQGIIFKVIIIVCLAKSIQAAIAYEREKAHSFAPSATSSPVAP